MGLYGLPTLSQGIRIILLRSLVGELLEDLVSFGSSKLRINIMTRLS